MGKGEKERGRQRREYSEKSELREERREGGKIGEMIKEKEQRAGEGRH